MSPKIPAAFLLTLAISSSAFAAEPQKMLLDIGADYNIRLVPPVVPPLSLTVPPTPGSIKFGSGAPAIPNPMMIHGSYGIVVSPGMPSAADIRMIFAIYDIIGSPAMPIAPAIPQAHSTEPEPIIPISLVAGSTPKISAPATAPASPAPISLGRLTMSPDMSPIMTPAVHIAMGIVPVFAEPEPNVTTAVISGDESAAKLTSPPVSQLPSLASFTSTSLNLAPVNPSSTLIYTNTKTHESTTLSPPPGVVLAATADDHFVYVLEKFNTGFSGIITCGTSSSLNAITQITLVAIPLQGNDAPQTIDVGVKPNPDEQTLSIKDGIITVGDRDHFKFNGKEFTAIH